METKILPNIGQLFISSSLIQNVVALKLSGFRVYATLATDKLCRVCILPGYVFRSEDLIIPESIAQDFDFTVVQGKQTHSRLRNCFSSAAVGSKDKLDSGIIEFSFLSAAQLKNLTRPT